MLSYTTELVQVLENNTSHEQQGNFMSYLYLSSLGAGFFETTGDYEARDCLPWSLEVLSLCYSALACLVSSGNVDQFTN